MTCGHQLRLSSLSSDSMRRTWGTPFASNVSKMRRTARGSMKRIAENGSEGSDGTAGRGNEQLGMLKHGTEGSEEPMQKSVLILRGLTSRVYAGLDKCKGQECLEVRPLWNMTKGYLIKSLVTTLLTIYALIGDDMRLIFSEKAADDTFNIITTVTMVVFGLEVIINTFGKQGYLCGFFFLLDFGSTITLILDLTYVSEALFGDSISSAQALAGVGKLSEREASAGPVVQGPVDQSSSQSADAARAARMSRVGTKACLLESLIRLVKFYQKNTSSPKYQAGESVEATPGMDWEEDDDDMQKESAVSKKLSEMTTRRVVMLVLVIMLSLPFFQPGMYNDDLSTSAQYGVNVLYRRWRDDMSLYEPYANDTAQAAYMSSKGREVYVDDFFLYSYYHSPFTQEDLKPSTAVSSPLSSFNSLFFAGVHPDNETLGQFFLPSFEGRGTTMLGENARFAGTDWLYYQGNLTSDPEALLFVPYPNTTSCVGGAARGVSLLAAIDANLDCPEKLRYNERTVIVPTAATSAEYEEIHFIFVFDRRSGARLEAILNTAQTIFICFLLGFGAMTFSQDANRLVLTPIERMISKLDKIRNNPLEAMTIGDEEHHREQALMCDAHIESAAKRGCCSRTIIKIGSLLALGFGEAGAEIIGQNMRGGDSAALNVADKYTVIRGLGRGKFGQVSEVQHKVTKERFAWKQVLLDQSAWQDIEVRLLSRMKHKNIVRLYDVFQEQGIMDMMLELCTKGSMTEYMADKVEKLGGMKCYLKPSTWEIWNALQQLLSAVSFLHENQVAHRDIKPDNVLQSRGHQWKLADFNLACEIPQGFAMSGRAGTRPFMAPEVDQGNLYTEKCDLYSTGVLFVGLVCGAYYVQPGENPTPKMLQDAEKLLDKKTWKQEESIPALELAKHMLAPECDRCDAEEALNSPWMLQPMAPCCVIS
ncbi:Serine/threonine-protein kinase PEPKR2 (Protein PHOSPHOENOLPYRUVATE CARBOXYLASE-RELATED KINASE 2) [Durusdinium trenchii]|uniref:Serine/threonine-protein kinase PEPKR2 (Protein PHOSPHOENOLPYRUVATE CARBOXYLASE-RELATED KINASE 2) n=1 Tax=Durusdinium trenchii TaxID=1381693 RepID=A0ABP0RBW2_9DINO